MNIYLLTSESDLTALMKIYETTMEGNLRRISSL